MDVLIERANFHHFLMKGTAIAHANFQLWGSHLYTHSYELRNFYFIFVCVICIAKLPLNRLAIVAIIEVRPIREINQTLEILLWPQTLNIEKAIDENTFTLYN